MTLESFCNSIWNNTFENVNKDITKDDYKEFKIPKKNGYRTINYIEETSKLFNLQNRLNKKFLSKQSLPTCVKGFKKGESYISYLKEHVGSKFFLRIDIANFFPSITSSLIKAELDIIVNGYTIEDKIKIIDLITNITTLNDCLPQGASTSPVLSNIVMARIDQRILKYCQLFNVKYTRYADDMLFSSETFDFNKKWFVRKIKYILNSIGLKLNYSKLKIANDEISLNGYVISKDGIRLSRSRLSDIRHILSFSERNYNAAKTDNEKFILEANKLQLKHRTLSISPFSTVFQFVQYLCGYRAFLISILDRNEVNKFQKELQKLINKIEKNILKYV